jgi:hypothetical protein
VWHLATLRKHRTYCERANCRSGSIVGHSETAEGIPRRISPVTCITAT